MFSKSSNLLILSANPTIRRGYLDAVRAISATIAPNSCFHTASQNLEAYGKNSTRQSSGTGYDRKRSKNYGSSNNYNNHGNNYGNNYGNNNRGSNSYGGGYNSFQGSTGRKGNARGTWGGKNKTRDSERDQEKVIGRNRLSNRGGEGDGLRGLDDYEVDILKLRGLEWTDLLPKVEEKTSENAESGSESETSTESEKSSSESAAGFSGVPTLELANQKVVSRVLVNSLHYNRKYTSLTPVQAQTLIPILRNESVVVRAKTGTGKTAAFAIPTLQKVLEAKRAGEEGVKAVIISPTRELAQQIADEITAISTYGELRKIKTQCFVGGLSKDRQLKLGFLNKPVVDIVVATPGRLYDILEDDNVLKHFKGLRFKVLDEADRLLDIGFRNELEAIRDRLAEVVEGEVPTLLFSATIDQTVRSFARDEFGQRAKIVDTVPKNEPTAAELVEQHSIVCSNWAQMYTAGVEYIEKELVAAKNALEESNNGAARPFKAVLFMPSVVLVENFAKVLSEYFADGDHGRNFVHTLHGQMTQASRQRISDSYRKSRQSILVTTDVVARGMDFPQVTHVFQIGVPSDVASYIHRIGRTARIGNSGKSFLILSKYEKDYLNRLQSAAKITMANEVNTYKPDAEVASKVAQAVPESIVDEEEANDIYNNVLISVGSIKRSYRMDSRAYIRDHQQFADLFGLDTPILAGSAQKIWTDRREPRHKGGRGSFRGGSRQSRMKW
ncbi:Mss116p [Sugiyamaella lignohabitans]|uniref:ATP-dependent RNA helicase n=1 Tax=Sugiyamaella lignohabitans TaxID=796027 RepID=A0A161HHJ6_9ASCO|nr:Mss116p [Sugiyamaella lignohabitans]ANB11637.1 Mss116p [Sugiyamaella lignohabitans]